MGKHRRNQSCVVNVSTGDLMFGDELAPVHKDCRCLFEQWKQIEEPINFLVHRSDWPAEAISLDWSACDRPELDQVLRRQIDFVATLKQRHQGIDGERVMGRCALHGA
jgi:hypothetical protein